MNTNGSMWRTNLITNTRRNLLIDVNDYPLAFGRLDFCVSNAKLLENALSVRRAGFEAIETILLTDDQPVDQQPGRNNSIANTTLLVS